MKLETRELCLTIEILNNEEKEAQKVLTHFISNSFKINVQSTDFELVKQYYEALKNEEMTPALRELFNKTKHGNPEFGRVIEAYLFYAGVTFIKRSNVQDLKKAFQSARVFIDQREDYQFLNHSLAVSAGLPILSKTPSPYLMEGENGFIFKDDHQLLEDVQYYLSQPDHWNKNLVESVSVIEKNSAEALVEKWKGVLK
ncbi:accessory Sec system glycosyltransferase Asp1 [Lactococcus lactis]|nr:accessory Sec system glycosyltransferase Asp1 [Lactococcus lactis]